jgi:type II secretory pathway pseudopilin PulG
MRQAWAPRPPEALQRGFTFIGVLIVTAVIGVGLAGLGQVWSVHAQRERERELLFVGDQYRAAILSYSASTPAGKPRYPRDLDDLLDDKRHPVTRRHLRQLYPDPLTGKADWEIVRSPEGGIVAVHSRHGGSPMKVGNFPRQFSAFETAATYRDWVFGAPPPGSSPQRR